MSCLERLPGKGKIKNRGGEDIHELRSESLSAIEAATPIFQKHRGWHGLNAALRGFLGVLAAITIIPGVAVALGTKQGYVGTFFSKPQTDTKQKLEALKKALDREITPPEDEGDDDKPPTPHDG